MKHQLENCFVNIQNNTEYFEAIQNSLRGNNKATFFYLNSYSFYLVNKNHDFRKAFNNANFVIADGYSIVWLLKVLKKVNIEKVVFTYSFFQNLADLFSKEKSKIFILGGTQSVIEKAAQKMKSKFKLNIVGYSNGFFNSETQNDGIIEQINNANPDILICGMGMPKSEIWIQKDLNNINTKIIFSVGGFFDFLTGKNKSAPKWMYNSGLEWIHRLVQEPNRLFKRYFIANTYLIYNILKTKLKHAIK